MANETYASALKITTRPASYRWIQLFMGIVCMAMIANLQYGWTLFVNPIADKYGWTKAAIQVAFTIFVLTETWLVPIEGYLVDRFGPRPVVLVGGLLCGRVNRLMLRLRAGRDAHADLLTYERATWFWRHWETPATEAC